MNIFEKNESNVRSYCRSFPTVFNKAKDSFIYSEEGREYIDFFDGAGSLNYGHNNEYLKTQILNYLEKDGIVNGLDMYTTAKKEFISTFIEKILTPRNMEYKIQFCGSTGANAVEAALKLARKFTKRNNILAFMGAYHGLSLGSLAATSNNYHRSVSGVNLANVSFIPYPGEYFSEEESIKYINTVLTDSHSGIDKPAAIIFETVQAEGGVNIASDLFLKSMSDICKSHDILSICDDIQVGCGRTGRFFSFERAEIQPDIIILSKSISGYGFPMSVNLIKPEIDIWEPGEHTGTFRGNQLAFVAAKAAIDLREMLFMDAAVNEKGEFIKEFLNTNILTINPEIAARGIGLIWGVDVSKVPVHNFAARVSRMCFQKGLIIERAGRGDNVLKIMPPLIISQEILEAGLLILKESLVTVISESDN